ncbi:MAG: hypothetical protein ACD_60C00087G0037 [uncultured bacterium]|nr:MAG: hypothetical protein ACD_60C00087G0037 [uncultured bacterium]
MNTLEFVQFADYLKPRPRDAHKGDFGHVLVMGGQSGYSGAVQLAALAALRVGAGLVSVATHPAHAEFLNMTHPEIMSHGIDSPGALSDLLVKATVIVLGPGLGLSAWSKKLFSAALEAEKPLVLDADGLNLLAENPCKKTSWILTPHPGEAARLLKKSTTDIQQDRVEAIKQLQRQFNGEVVLKGSGSLVLGSKDNAPFICTLGNPGMATAGMGDVLSGVLGGLIAQGIPTHIAAKLGVLVHAMAGDLAAEMGERGMIASDVIPYLRNIVNVKKGE